MPTVWDEFSDPVTAESWDDFSDPVQPAAPEQPSLLGSGEPTRGRYVTLRERTSRQKARERLFREEYPQPTSMWDMNPSGDPGGGEVLANLVTGGGAAAAAGIAGIAQGAKNLFSPGMPAADRVEQVQGKLTYQPHTEGGQRGVEQLMYPLEKFSQGTDWLGEKASDVTGSPAVGAAIKTAGDMAPALLTRVKVGRGNPVPRPARATLEAGKASEVAPVKARKPGLAAVSEEAPTLDKLRSDRDAAYKKADESGVVISRKAMNRLKIQLVNDLKKEGLHSKLTPKAAIALEEIVKAKGQPTLGELENLRKIAGKAAGSLEKPDARMASRIIEKIDDFEENLVEADLVGGDSAGISTIKEARALHARVRKAETIEDIFTSAKRATGANYTVAGMETALRQKFRQLAESKKKIRGFNAEERAAIDQFISGGKMDNFLRRVGKFAPDGLASGWAAIAAAAYNPLLAAIPAVGSVGKFASTRIGMKKANAISEMVRRGPNRPLGKTPTRYPESVEVQ